jgi:pyruvate/2-oxoglutarate dehydrogenase complex dihydrolipoamide dehydrogenase (E3) component
VLAHPEPVLKVTDLKNEIACDVCVIGAGSAGLSVAAGTAQLGLRTVLIEAGLMGGDCLNTGCVPSKALLAAAKQAYAHERSEIEGIEAHPAGIDRQGVKRHVQGTIEAIAPHDSEERFESLGVRIIRQRAAFESPELVTAGDTAVRAKHFVIAAGSRAAIPPIPGLDPDRVLTNETIFALDAAPEHLIVIGGGPIGIEMAQAHRRLHSRVTVLEMRSILPKDAPELVGILRKRLEAEGIDIRENVAVRSVQHGEGEHRIEIEADGGVSSVTGTHLLVAAGRQVNVSGLGLVKANIEFDNKGIKTDARLRTSQKHIFAVGDIAGGPQFTHVAGYQAGVVVRNIAFRLPAKVDYSALPWVTYTDPELAHVGLTLEGARAQFGQGVRSVLHSFEGVDRAVAERRSEGCISLVAGPNGRILGCSILGPGAGEMIGLWALAIKQKLKLRALTELMLPYPTYSEIGKQVASEWYKPALFSDRTRWIVGYLQKLPQF